MLADSVGLALLVVLETLTPAERIAYVLHDMFSVPFCAQREVVEAFLAASRDGDFDALVAVLDPDIVLRADTGEGALTVIHGAETVARQATSFAQLGLVVRQALVNGVPGWVTTLDGAPFSVGAFTVRGGRITAMDILADPDRLARLDLTVLE